MLCILASSCEPPPAYNDFHAIELLARQGDAMAQYRLGLMYDIGENVEKNNSESVKWFFRSAEQGVAEAQHRLGLLYEYGQGVPKNDVEAAKWYVVAADLGHPEAQYEIGRMYYSALGGLSRNYIIAFDFFRKAAEQGNVKSQHMLGEMYYTGFGVQQSYFHSFVWLSIAEIGGETSSSVRDTSAKALSPADLEAAQDYIAKLIEAIEAAKTARS